MLNFSEQLSQIINDNNSFATQSEFAPVAIGSRHQFIGRVLPLEPGAFPFVTYHEAWVSYTKKNGDATSVPVIVDPNDPSDKLAEVLTKTVAFNRDYNKSHPGHQGDAIKLASGKFPLNVRSRSAFLGVELIKSATGYSQATNEQGQPVIKSYTISWSALNSIAHLLKPDFPYMYQGKPMFKDEYQFITTNTTFPIHIKTERGSNGRWEVNVQPIQGMLMPKIEFNYLEKDDQGNYKYVDNLEKELAPVKVRNPKFYNALVKQLSESFENQKKQLEEEQVNPYASMAPSNEMPFPTNGVSPKATPSMVAPVATPSSTPTPNVSNSAPGMSAPNVTDNPFTQTAPSSAPQNVANSEPVAPTPTSTPSQSPIVNSDSDDGIGDLFDQSQSLDDFLGGLK